MIAVDHELRLELCPFVLPAGLLPNRAARLHGWATSMLRLGLRHDAAIALRSVIVRRGHERPVANHGLAPVVGRFIGPTCCRLTIAYERELTQGKTGRRRCRQHADPDAIIAAAKPIFDALQDMGLIANDRDLVHVQPVKINDPDGEGWIAVELWQDAANSPCPQAYAPLPILPLSNAACSTPWPKSRSAGAGPRASRRSCRRRICARPMATSPAPSPRFVSDSARSSGCAACCTRRRHDRAKPTRILRSTGLS
jgi:hypothetical protein